MGFFSRLLNRPGAQADKRVGWFDRSQTAVTQRGEEYADLTDEQLTDAARTVFDTGSREDQLVRFAALAREAAARVLDERPYDTQLRGLIGLLDGNVVQMLTGEGKTLVGALTAAGYALQGRRVHVVSVNDYLAVRDHAWMSPLFELLGVSADAVSGSMTDTARRDAYRAEIVYGSVSEIGFDVLRDRFRLPGEEVRVEARDVVVVDEADSVLIDEARVPLVLAGSTKKEDADQRIARLVAQLDVDEHIEVTEDRRAVSLTPAGIDEVEHILGVELYGDDPQALASVNIALYARMLVHRDVDYLVVDGAIKLIDAARGRIAQLQRWPDGLQAAVEAKEKLETSTSGEILDQMTVEELVHSYERVCGMTGTALAVGDDLREFYELEIVAVEPHEPVIRIDEPDRLYTFQESKERAIVEEVAEAHASDRPVLVGTRSVAESESLAARLRERGIDCEVLNAKDDSREAQIISRAGETGAVTVSTQMAGRGTDIRLGGEDVAEAGGLLVIGAGRYESSRLDDQLRGRAGRQGDPGSSVFFTSLEDELMSRVPEAQRFVEEGDETGLITAKRAALLVEHAQRMAEGENTAVHRDTWRFNELMAQQRQLVLTRREEVREGARGVEELRARLGTGRVEEIEDAQSASVLDDAIRDVLLFAVDDRWVEHLAYLNDLREGIHLRTLAREKPHEAFNEESIQAFSGFWDDVLDRAEGVLQNADFTADGLDLPAHGLKRPSSTWTYLTTENVFGSDLETIVKTLRRG
ncbi:accessory Sec system translocase SecA2 [Brevibacterium yomogidense]|uniref:accessory Sec system translocase SecA2 n=1 Tax=Brevibacterium yomogidense TaxID=946573 RepID=UPI0018DF27F8|nr:accessory Sec system translocase SecA2 [Brevibacterium yomogidense]